MVSYYLIMVKYERNVVRKKEFVISTINGLDNMICLSPIYGVLCPYFL